MKRKPVLELNDEDWLRDLGFNVNITTHLNDFNGKLPTRDQYANEMFGHINLFKNKLVLWHIQLAKGDATHFSTLAEQLSNVEVNRCGDYSAQVSQLLDLSKERLKDFKYHEDERDLFAVPFNFNVERVTPQLQLDCINHLN